MPKNLDFEVVGEFRPVEADVVPVLSDGKKLIPAYGAYSPLLERFRKDRTFLASLKSTQFVRYQGGNNAAHLLFLGMGKKSELTDEKLRVLGGVAWQRLTAERVKSARLLVDGFRGMGNLSAFLEGVGLPAYRFEKYKTKTDPKENTALQKFQVVLKNKNDRARTASAVSAIEKLLDCVGVTRDWSNEPSNVGTPSYFAEQARSFAKKHGLKCRILGEADARREGMGLLLGVAQGSEEEAKMVIVEYSPRASGKKAKTLALVGKGVTFDTGGISIKPALHMEDMKHDMTGAATVFGAVLLAAQWKVPHRVIGVMAFTENTPDGAAIHPGCILKSRAGKTIEVINTDAEGRLVLADALDYVQEMKPDVIVDVATLTGAVGIALGKYCCAILGNDKKLIQDLIATGEELGERIWELPLYDEYLEDMKSEIADLKNVGAGSYGGVSRAAAFLKEFIRPGFKWAHLDIATTAYDLAHLTYIPKKGASGSYVRTLAQLAKNL